MRTRAFIKTLLLLIGSGFILILLLWFLFSRGYLRLNYPSYTKFPVRGIDVSHHQGKIDWAGIPKEEVHFAYIKATEGGDFQDPRFLENWTNAKGAGIKVGAYHFFTFCRPVSDQINNFISTVPVEQGDLPPALDLEYEGNCSKSSVKIQVPHDIDKFVEVLRIRYGKEPVLYTTYEFYEARLKPHAMLLNRVWIRSIFGAPERSPDWIIWQFANRGRLPGIATPVDLNVFRGTFADLDAF